MEVHIKQSAVRKNERDNAQHKQLNPVSVNISIKKKQQQHNNILTFKSTSMVTQVAIEITFINWKFTESTSLGETGMKEEGFRNEIDLPHDAMCR